MKKVEEVRVEHGTLVNFGGAVKARTFTEACPKCGVLTVGLRVLTNAKHEGWWICGTCGKATEVTG